MDWTPSVADAAIIRSLVDARGFPLTANQIGAFRNLDVTKRCVCCFDSPIDVAKQRRCFKQIMLDGIMTFEGCMCVLPSKEINETGLCDACDEKETSMTTCAICKSGLHVSCAVDLQGKMIAPLLFKPDDAVYCFQCSQRTEATTPSVTSASAPIPAMPKSVPSAPVKARAKAAQSARQVAAPAAAKQQIKKPPPHFTKYPYASSDNVWHRRGVSGKYSFIEPDWEDERCLCYMTELQSHSRFEGERRCFFEAFDSMGTSMQYGCYRIFPDNSMWFHSDEEWDRKRNAAVADGVVIGQPKDPSFRLCKRCVDTDFGVLQEEPCCDRCARSMHDVCSFDLNGIEAFSVYAPKQVIDAYAGTILCEKCLKDEQQQSSKPPPISLAEAMRMHPRKSSPAPSSLKKQKITDSTLAKRPKGRPPNGSNGLPKIWIDGKWQEAGGKADESEDAEPDKGEEVVDGEDDEGEEEEKEEEEAEADKGEEEIDDDTDEEDDYGEEEEEEAEQAEEGDEVASDNDDSNDGDSNKNSNDSSVNSDDASNNTEDNSSYSSDDDA